MALGPCSAFKFPIILFLLSIFAWDSPRCDGFRTFNFNMHHRFSDPVKGVLSVDELPLKGSLEYYAALAHRDRTIRGRGLASNGDKLLTFSSGNMTFRISSLGFLHYANVSLGTPSKWFLVALDTGSNLFWVPCDCTRCVGALVSGSGAELDLNIYSPNASLTSKKVPCDSSLCELQRRCPETSSSCPYQVAYLSNNTSSSGILIEDVLHMVTNDNKKETVDAPITFGCGKVQTGAFLDGAAPNGLFGLGVDKLSVPSILAGAGLAADSFSMCFGNDGLGRLSFGDKGSSDQDETLFHFDQLHPTYNVSVTQISVGENVIDLVFSAVFDSGTSFTYLNDPAYTQLSESFDSQVQDNRHPHDSMIPFEYCYDFSLNANSTMVPIMVPIMNLTMKGGKQFSVYDPIIIITNQSIYCLAVVKSSDVDIIGQNFMTGHRIVFDREKLVLGWKKSNCYDVDKSSTLPINPRNSTAVPPALAVEPGNYAPEATNETGTRNRTSGATPALESHSVTLNPLNYALGIIILPFLAIF